MTAQEKYIFLIVAFCQAFPSCRTLRIFSFLPMVTPFIGTESSAALQNLSYQEGEFDENWNGDDVKWALGALIATYLVDVHSTLLWCVYQKSSEKSTIVNSKKKSTI